MRKRCGFDSPAKFRRGLVYGVGFSLPPRAIIIALGLLIFGCTGLKQTAKEPLHAETGGGITIWKIPVVGIGEWGAGSYGRMPGVIIYKYDYAAKPQPMPPGTPPTPPWMSSPEPVDYPTIYGSAWDDPSLVIFKNESYRRTRVQIGKQKPIILEPYNATADIHLGIGEHRIKVIVEKPTEAHGIWEEINIFSIYISPEGRSQIIRIYDW